MNVFFNKFLHHIIFLDEIVIIFFTDDRYVLKEMTKPEWQQFLEFAPHYFGYVTQCKQNNSPSLLGKHSVTF